MSQIIIEQLLHYAAKMTRNKHFPNTIDTNCAAKDFLSKVVDKARLAHKIFAVAKILIRLLIDIYFNIKKGQLSHSKAKMRKVALENLILKSKIYNLFKRMQKLCEILKLLCSIFKVFKVYW